MVLSLTAYLAGLALGGSLVIAIGAQNAFVLQQGLRRQHVGLIAAICSAIDAVLIAIGATGFGSLVSSSPTLAALAAWGGAVFLLVYGARSLRSAARKEVLDADDGKRADEEYSDIRRTVVYTLAVSLLNPHVYLDTVVILGTVATGYPGPGRVWFALGAASASFIWFFSLGYGARTLAPLFARPRAWQVLDVVIALIMWWIAVSLVFGQLLR